MNSVPASSSAATMERPMALVESRFSSERVEMPSKPRKLSTAMETAPKARLQEKWCELYSGVKSKPRPLPLARAITPTTRKTASTTSSPTSTALLTLAVVSMPR